MSSTPNSSSRPPPRSRLTHLTRDHYASLLLVVCGLAVAWQGFNYKMGTLAAMGPGFVPVCLGVILALLGVALGIGAIRSAAVAVSSPAATPTVATLTATVAEPRNPITVTDATAPTPIDRRDTDTAPQWRGWFCIMGGIIAFIVVGQFAGLLPATFATVFIAALGDNDNSVRSSFLLALAMTGVCYLVFHLGLAVQFPLFHGA